MARAILGPDEIDRYPHRSDLMATMHNDGFRKDPVFASALDADRAGDHSQVTGLGGEA